MNTINIKLIPFEQKYLQEILDLNVKCTKALGAYFGPALQVEDLHDIGNYYSKSKGNFILAIDEIEQLVGIGAYQKVDEITVEIKRMRVKVEHQGKGIGKKILNFLISDALNNEYKRFILETSNRQLPAIKFYKSFGFNIYEEEIIEGITCYWLELIQPDK